MVTPASIFAASLIAVAAAPPVSAAPSSEIPGLASQIVGPSSQILGQNPACTGMLDQTPERGPAKPAGIEDLLALRDIGLSHVGDLGHAMTVSPDGREIALVLTRGDPRTNSYCQVLIVVRTDGQGRPRVLDTVGQPDLSRSTIRGVYNPSGLPSQNVPLWSPDGARLAYQKRAETRGEAWQVEVATGVRTRVSPAGWDAERIAWLAGGQTLGIAYRTGRADAETALREEGLSGYLFDDRFLTYASNRPRLRANLPLEYRGIDLPDLRERELTEDERSLVTEPRSNDPTKLLSATNRTGGHVWTASDRPKEWLSPVRIWAAGKDGKAIRCDEPGCVGDAVSDVFLSLWWSEDGKTAYWIRRTGWSRGDIGLYHWKPGQRAVKVLQTSDLLLDCQLSPSGLYCLHESSKAPRKIVRIDETSGSWQTVYDPNPQWTSLRLGKVERLHWRNENGFEVFGDLVLPPDYRPGTRLPLIVTQYTSRGFLRGGTGDAFPIFPFASRGYAVLSFNMPKQYSMGVPDGHWASFQEADRATNREWQNRRSMLSAVMNGIDLVIGRGLVDPKAVGITGLSDGSTTAQFAIVAHPDRFAAASVEACCVEPQSLMVFGGAALADERRAWGFPDFRGDDLKKWKPISPSLNAETIKTPLLISNGDNEYLSGVETFTALRDAGKAAEMYIYPGEHHLVIEPAHRAAIYKRNIAWFDFWLRRRENLCMASEAEYERWRKMTGAPAEDQLTRSTACPPGP